MNQNQQLRKAAENALAALESLFNGRIDLFRGNACADAAKNLQAALAAPVQPQESGELASLIKMYVAYRINAYKHGNKYGDVDGSENCWRRIRDTMLAADAQREQKLKKCRSPYCECESGKCTQPGFYDARREPWPEGGYL